MTFRFSFHYPGLYAAMAQWLSLWIWSVHLTDRNKVGFWRFLPLLSLPALLAVWMLLPGDSLWGYYLCYALSAVIALLILWAATQFGISDVLYYGCHILMVARLVCSFGWQNLYIFFLALGWHYDYNSMPPISDSYLQLLRIANMGGAIVLGFLALFVYLHLRKPRAHNTWSVTVYAISAFLISGYVGNLFSWFDQSFFAVAVSDAAIILRCVSDFLGLTMLIGLEEMARRTELNRELFETYRVLERQNEQYRQYRANDEAMRRLYHDMKHQIAFARSEPDAEKRESYLANLDQIVRRHESAITTGNSVLDTLFSGKNQSCLESGITMTVFADAAGLDFVDTMDLCSMFGNALDNAIECEERIADPQKRLIKVEITPKTAICYIKIDNYCETPPEFLDGYPVTTKSDARFHGYGVRSIQKTAEKYGGHSAVRWENNWFSLTILLPIPA